MIRHTVLATFLGLAAGTSALAQRPTTPAPRSGWLPPENRLGGELTCAQQTAAIATLERIQGLLQQVPELANPDGFEIQPIFGGGSRPIGPDEKVMAGAVAEHILTLMFYVPTKAIAGEGCGCITVRVNPLPPSGGLRDAQGRTVYIEPDRARQPEGTPEQVAGTLWQVPGATQVYGELWEPVRDRWHGGVPQRSGVSMLFTPPGTLPWLPVSRETLYEAALIDQEGADGNKLAEYRAGLEKTPYQQWMEDAAERRRNREDILRQAVQFQTAAEVAQLRKTLEDTEREVTEQLRSRDAEDRERNQAALVASHGYREALRLDLERMTPEERRMPAYVDMEVGDGPKATGWPLTAKGDTPSRRVLMPNYDFWRARRSPVEVRSITVTIGIGGTGLYPKVRQALLQTFRTLDWAAFNQLLDSSPP